MEEVHIEDMAANGNTGRVVIHYVTPEDIGAVCVINPDGSIAMQVEYHVLAASATRYNIEINRAHPAGGGQ